MCFLHMCFQYRPRSLCSQWRMANGEWQRKSKIWKTTKQFNWIGVEHGRSSIVRFTFHLHFDIKCNIHINFNITNFLFGYCVWNINCVFSYIFSVNIAISNHIRQYNFTILPFWKTLLNNFLILILIRCYPVSLPLFFALVQDLKELRCRRCALKKIEANLFQSIPRLLELDVGENYVNIFFFFTLFTSCCYCVTYFVFKLP